MTSEELQQLEIRTWTEIKPSYNGADLLLGNGFSINISNQLQYNSLFDKFLEYCSTDMKRIFKSFKTTNFELILEKLNNGIEVNKVFSITNTSKIEEAIENLKNGLIRAIENNHPRYEDIYRKLIPISAQLDQFNDIFTLNYDVFLYHLIMTTLDRHRQGIIRDEGRYQDFFWGYKSLRDYLEFMGFQLHPYKNVYYLHGALFLFDFDGNAFKLKRKPDKDLLDNIREQISIGNLPLFIAEGTHADKMKAIKKNRYLTFCYDALKENRNKMVVFGASFLKDSHIIKAIEATPRHLAIGIHVGSRPLTEIDSEKHKYLSIFTKCNRQYPIDFFNSSTLFNFMRRR